ncbi:hypothetical protein SAEN111111_24960 [Saccharibacillus endophyticus]
MHDRKRSLHSSLQSNTEIDGMELWILFRKDLGSLRIKLLTINLHFLKQQFQQFVARLNLQQSLARVEGYDSFVVSIS